MDSTAPGIGKPKIIPIHDRNKNNHPLVSALQWNGEPMPACPAIVTNTQPRVLVLSVRPINNPQGYRVRVATGPVKGTIYARVDGFVVYPRQTKLGEVLLKNSNSERAVIAQKIREITGRDDLARQWVAVP